MNISTGKMYQPVIISCHNCLIAGLENGFEKLIL